MKKRIIFGSTIGIVVILIVWGIVASKNKPAPPTITATLGSITEEILVTGSTKPSQSVDLSFERTGKVSGVYVKIGDAVRVGQALVELEKRDLLAQLAQTQAGVASAQATLDALKRGTRPEEIAIQEVKVANAQIAMGQAEQSVLDAVIDAYAKADDAVRNKTDDIFKDPRSGNPQIEFIVTNPQFEIDSKNQKAAVERTLTGWKAQVDSLAVGSDLLAASAIAQSNLNMVKLFLDKVALMLNSSLPTPDILQTTLDGYKTSTSTARAAVAVSISATNTAETALRAANATLTLERNNLALNRAGSTPEAIAAQQALVDQAQAGVQGIQVSLGKTILRSPINGVITVQGAKLGQIVTVTTASAANTSLISIISLKKLEIDAFAPEVNVGRLAVGQKVRITFDAFPGEDFQGSIIEIDPAETVIDGVVNYKMKTELDGDDPRIKSGLTANLTIETAVKNDVVLLPQNAILQNDQGTFVRVPDGKTTKDVPVKLGVRSSSGTVEIVSGVSAGDVVEDVGAKR